MMNFELYSLINQVFNLPIYICKSVNIITAFPDQLEITYPPASNVYEIYDMLFRQNNPIVHYVASNTLYFSGICIDRDEHEFMIVGPISSTGFESSMLIKMHLDFSVPQDERNTFDSFFKQIPVMSYYDFVKITMLINFTLNQGEILDPVQQYTKSINETSKAAVDNSLADQILSEEIAPQIPYEVEARISGYIEQGDLESIEKFIFLLPSYTYGKLADTALRQEKNAFIASMALFSRAAIRGGLDTATALHLSDIYIQNVEKTITVQDIYNLYFQALKDLTNRVRESSWFGQQTGLAQKCIVLARQNVNRKLTVTDIAKELGYSRTYLSKCFKAETGFGLSSFILRCKLEESAILLKYSNKSIAEISSFLCFSSQSHFQSCFKEQFGMTPLKYRQS